ncbi:MAG TPA: hypothetical protein VL125_07290 [Pelobium sp.]|nr:hypothetical protein [Pelobium sp.]
MMRTNLNLLFFLKKRINYKSGPVAIYVRFTVDGQRAEASTGKTCDPKNGIQKPEEHPALKKTLKA